MRILHLFDIEMESWDYETLGRLAEAERGGSNSVRVELANMGARIPHRFARVWPRSHRLGFPTRVPLAAAVWLRRILKRSRSDLIHAWDVLPAITAQMAGLGGRPLLLGISRPLTGPRECKWLVAARRDTPLAVVCPSGTIRRSLVERGHPPTDVGIIRPSVDFSRINAAARAEQRARLGLTSEQPVLITLPPPSREGGQYFAIWSAALLEQIYPDIRIIVPGVSRERCRLKRFVCGFRKPHLVLFPGRDVEFVDLLAAADVCVAAAVAPVSTVSMAWAMGSRVPIVGSAIPSIAEMIAHDHNGLLCRAMRPNLLAGQILKILKDEQLADRLADVARSQAFEVFSRRRMLEQYEQVYANLLEGREAFDRIADAAVNA